MANRPIPRQRTTRRPTGKPPLPLILLSGVQKSGKTWLAAEATTLPYFGRRFWFEIGEDGEADRYGALDGADYEIVEHDGSYRDIYQALQWAVAQPRVDGKPNMIIIDSGSVLWDLLSEEQQLIANRRAAEKAERSRRPFDTSRDATITPDQWNVANKRWRQVIKLLKSFDGLAIVTCRLDEVTVMDDAGNPTKDKTWKAKIQKETVNDVDAIIQLRDFRSAYVLGVRSVPPIFRHDETRHLPDFSIGRFLEMLGVLDGGATQQRQVVDLRPEAYLEEYEEEVKRLAQQERATAQQREAAARGELPDPEQVSRAISDAFTRPAAPDEKRRALLEVRSRYGASVLAQLPFKTMDGMTDANTAIDLALEKVRAMEPDPQQDRPATAQAGEHPQEWPQPAQIGGGGHQPTPPLTPKERKRQLLLDEAGFQAQVMGAALRDWVGPLLGEGRNLEDVPDAELAKWLVAQRPLVVDALRDSGRPHAADRYKAEGGKVPVNVAVVVDVPEPDHQAPAHA